MFHLLLNRADELENITSFGTAAIKIKLAWRWKLERRQFGILQTSFVQSTQAALWGLGMCGKTLPQEASCKLTGAPLL
jgi:hypothetical protein